MRPTSKMSGEAREDVAVVAFHLGHLRIFEQWDEQVPGFVEADLVAHCGSSVEGSYLCARTLTNIATGWMKCLLLLSKSAEAVLAAV